MGKPFKVEDGKYFSLLPRECFERELSYLSSIFGKVVHKEYELIGVQPLGVSMETLETVHRHGKITSCVVYPCIELFTFPVMVNSLLCHLVDFGCTSKESGGQFILGGQEKMLMNRERKAYNKIFVSKYIKGQVTYKAEIRSDHPNRIRSSATLYIFLGKTKRYNRNSLFVEMPHLKRHQFPWILLMRALGSVDDEELLHTFRIMANKKWNSEMEDILRNCIENDRGVKSQQDALIAITRRKGQLESDHQRQLGMQNCLRDLQRELLPRIGVDEKSFKKKVAFVCYMSATMIHKIQLSRLVGDNRSMTDPDSYVNKRIQNALELLTDITRQLWNNKEIPSLKNKITRTAARWLQKKNKDPSSTTTTTRDRPSPLDVPSLFNGKITSGGLQGVIKTGMWHVNIPSKGISQTGVSGKVERICPLVTLSQYTKVIRNQHRNARHTRPRMLHNSAFGTICSADSPDGSMCGIVVHTSAFNHVTLATPTHAITELLLYWGVRPMETISPEEWLDFLKVGYIMVMVNSNPIGFLSHSNCSFQTLIEKIKQAKRDLQISPCVSVSPELTYYIPSESLTHPLQELVCKELSEELHPHPCLVTEVNIRTEGGRCVRPFLNQDKLAYLIERLGVAQASQHLEHVSWPELLKSGLVEFLDKEEEITQLINSP